MALSKKDYTSLAQAVNKFNREVDKLEKLGTDLTAPSKIEFEDLQQKIVSKKGLDQTLNDLKSFNYKTVTGITLSSGEKMTDWEYNLLKSNQERALNSVNSQIQNYTSKKSGEQFSRAEMGSTNYNQLVQQRANIQSSLNKSVKQARERLEKEDVDSLLRKARLFKENYLATMEKYQGLAGYNEFIDKLQKIRNPYTFYKFVSKNELTKDLTYQSDQTYSQEEFSQFISLMGVTTDQINETGEVDQFYNSELIYRNINEEIDDLNIIDIEDEDLPF